MQPATGEGQGHEDRDKGSCGTCGHCRSLPLRDAIMRMPAMDCSCLRAGLLAKGVGIRHEMGAERHDGQHVAPHDADSRTRPPAVAADELASVRLSTDRTEKGVSGNGDTDGQDHPADLPGRIAEEKDSAEQRQVLVKGSRRRWFSTPLVRLNRLAGTSAGRG